MDSLNDIEQSLDSKGIVYYRDSHNKRILLITGESLYTIDSIALFMIDGTFNPDAHKTISNEETIAYENLYKENISYSLDELDENFIDSIDSVKKYQESNQTYKNFISFKNDIESFQRFHELVKSHGSDKIKDRLESEFSFFENHKTFLLKVYDFSKLLKENYESHVWGVGRGSSCSCLIMYIIGIHDIDPIEYDIPFSEFSKESNYD